MCSNIYFMALVFCVVYHLAAGVPNIRNILAGNRPLIHSEHKAEKRQEEPEPDFDHEVCLQSTFVNSKYKKPIFLTEVTCSLS